MYVIQDREAGNVIEEFETEQEAILALSEFENQDKDEGVFKENFYEIVKRNKIYISEA